MSYEHQVWSVPPGKNRPKMHSAFELSRWQFAEKLAAFLEDTGHEDVEVWLAELGDDEEEDGGDEEGDDEPELCG